MRKRLHGLWIAGALVLHGQTQVDLRTQAKAIDFSSAPSTKALKTGLVLPTTCSLGAMFFKTDALAGANLFACTATNTWTVQGGAVASAAHGNGAPTGACTVGSIYSDILNGATWACEGMVWHRVFSTTDVGPFVLIGQNGGVPTPPGVGGTALFFGTTGVARSVDSSGNVATMVRGADCFSAIQLVRSISNDGLVQCGAPVVTYTFPGGYGSSSNPQPGNWWMNGTTVPLCPVTSYQCYLNWASGTNQIAVTTSIPRSWDGGSASISIHLQGDGSGNTIQVAVSVGCATAGTSNIAFNPEHSFPSLTTSGNNYYTGTIASVNLAGCMANDMLVLRLSRLDSAGIAKLASMSVSFNVL